MRVIAIQRGVHIRISVVSENGPQDNQVVADQMPTEEVATPETPEEQAVEDDGSITVEV
jgi:hypothetical protein